MVLNVLRSKKFAKRTLTAVLLLIIPAFVLWGAGSVTKGSALVGKINGQKIYIEDLYKSREGMRAQLFLTYFNDYDTYQRILRNRPLLNYMSWERLIYLNEAKKRKLDVSNDLVLAFISSHPIFKRDSGFSPELYSYILRNSLNMDPRQFEELIRQNLKVRAVRRDILQDVNVSEKEVLEEFAKTRDKVILSYLLFDKDLFRDDITVSAAEILKEYDADTTRFFDPSAIEIEYIVSPYTDVSEKEASRVKLEKIYLELTEVPDSLPEISATHGLKHGKTGPFSRNDVIPGIPFFKELYDAAFALKPGEISEPVYSSDEKGNAYILKKTRDIPRKKKALADVSAEITEILKDKKSLMRALNKAKESYLLTKEKRKTFDEISQDTGIAAQRTKDISAGDYIENVGPASLIVPTARKRQPGEIISPFMVKKGAVITRVDKVIPADMSDFNKEKDAIHGRIMNEKEIVAMENWFEQNSSKIDLKKQLQSF